MNEQSCAPRGISIDDAAKQLGVSTKTVQRKIASDELKAVKIGSKTLITVASLDAFWASLPAAQFRSPKQKAA